MKTVFHFLFAITTIVVFFNRSYGDSTTYEYKAFIASALVFGKNEISENSKTIYVYGIVIDLKSVGMENIKFYIKRNDELLLEITPDKEGNIKFPVNSKFLKNTTISTNQPNGSVDVQFKKSHEIIIQN